MYKTQPVEKTKPLKASERVKLYRQRLRWKAEFDRMLKEVTSTNRRRLRKLIRLYNRLNPGPGAASLPTELVTRISSSDKTLDHTPESFVRSARVSDKLWGDHSDVRDANSGASIGRIKGDTTDYCFAGPRRDCPEWLLCDPAGRFFCLFLEATRKTGHLDMLFLLGYYRRSTDEFELWCRYYPAKKWKASTARKYRQRLVDIGNRLFTKNPNGNGS